MTIDPTTVKELIAFLQSFMSNCWTNENVQEQPNAAAQNIMKNKKNN